MQTNPMDFSVHVEQLRKSLPAIAPSMLKCDFSNLQSELERLDAGGAPVCHLDVMDGHFVPNLSYGALLIESLRRHTKTPFDAHLMVSDPAKYLDDYVKAGCNWITFHIEAVPNPVPLLRRIRESGCAAGIALNPKTPVEAIRAAVGECDLVLVMSVEPGFGGQSFIPSALEKVQAVRKMFGEKTLISIDGGIGVKTIASAATAGADLFVAGSAIFDRPDYRAAITELRQLAEQGRRSAH
jgi:ribulose-phosphate 3-epimerase